MAAKCCPTCGRAYAPEVVVGGVRRQRMFDFVAAHPEGVTVWQILDAVYGDEPGGGPERHNVVSVMAKAINKVLAPYGYMVRGSGGPGSRYRMCVVNGDE